MNRSTVGMPALLCLLGGLTGAAAAAQDEEAAAPPPDAKDAETEPEAPPEPRDLVDLLLEEIDELHQEIDGLRQALADAKLEAAEAKRQRDELQQFIQDHDALGRDFEQYREFIKMAQREARQRRAQTDHQRREAEKAERRARSEAAHARREQQDEEIKRVNEYRKAGFTPVGLDVFLGQTAFFYQRESGLGARVRWFPRLGRYLRVHPYTELDFSSMTISGSVLNASEDVRNIGVAMTFFDPNGNQVGAEIIQINNARPDVPYPFTSIVDMALNRPFASSSSYVLYADPADPAMAPVQTTPPPAKKQPY